MAEINDPGTPAQGSLRRWRVADWGPLGWIETVLKLGGVAVGVAALLATLGESADGPSGARLAQVIVLGLLSVGLVAAIADRIADREIIGVVFVLAMNLGHWCMTVALARDGDLAGHLVAFAGLMLAGDLVKLVFLRTTGFRVRDISPAVVYGLTGTYALGYAALLLLQTIA
ncbi:MAG: hypothetical protein ACLGG9_08405 [Thermoleophilia bacterium]|jgi:hypothetical protein